jgi:hypothetical protein
MMRSRHDIYCDTLYRGLLNIRGAAHAGDAEQCFIEADHLHNIPGLLRSIDDEKLHRFYWDVMRLGYLHASNDQWSSAYAALWDELRENS